MNKGLVYFLNSIFLLTVLVGGIISPVTASAQDVTFIQDEVHILRARVVEVLGQEERLVPGTDTRITYQTIEVEILEGDQKGEIVTVESDFLALKEGARFFLRHSISGVDGREIYTVYETDRRGPMFAFVGLFMLVVILFSGKQGVRSVISLAASFFIILYILVPSLLQGYPPVMTSVALSAVILFFAVFFTHGFNRESLVAFIGTVAAVILTGVLAYIGVEVTELSGLSSEESVHLNYSTRGALDLSGLLLGGIMIGVLGVLDDIAITQSAVVSELYSSAPHLSKKEIYTRALRVGKEHVGALVNTLALAYAGASLPLLLLFSTSDSSVASIINREVFATEIIRTAVGSIGLILTVPITTLLAVYMLKGYKGKGKDGHGHSHLHGGHHH